MRTVHAPSKRSRRFSRARLVALGCIAVVMMVAVLAAVHAPRASAFDAAGIVMESGAHQMAPGGAAHASTSAVPPSTTCAICGGEQEGVAAACALILVVMATLRVAPRTPGPVVTVTYRPRPLRARWREMPRPKAPSLAALCIMRT